MIIAASDIEECLHCNQALKEKTCIPTYNYRSTECQNCGGFIHHNELKVHQMIIAASDIEKCLHCTQALKEKTLHSGINEYSVWCTSSLLG